MDIILQILVLVVIIIIALLVAQKLGLVYVTSIFGGYGYNDNLPKDMNVMILSKLPIKELERQKRVSKEINELFKDDYWRPMMKIAWLRSHGFVERGEDIDPVHYDIEYEIERFAVGKTREEILEAKEDPRIIEIFSGKNRVAVETGEYFHTQHYKLHPDLMKMHSDVISNYAPLKYIMSHPEPDFPDCKWDIEKLQKNKAMTLDFMENNPKLHGMTWTPNWATNPNITLKDLNRLKWTLNGVKADVKETLKWYGTFDYKVDKQYYTAEDVIKAMEIINPTPNEYRELGFREIVLQFQTRAWLKDDTGIHEIKEYLKKKNFV